MDKETPARPTRRLAQPRLEDQGLSGSAGGGGADRAAARTSMMEGTVLRPTFKMPLSGMVVRVKTGLVSRVMA